MLGWFSLVFIGVLSLWWYALLRSPAAKDRPSTEEFSTEEPATEKSSTEKEFSPANDRVHDRWIIGGGIVLPLLTIAILLLVGVPAGYRMLPVTTAAEVLRINVTGHQWWWEIHYPDTGLRLRNEIHIPAGVPVDIHLSTADVLHAFWVPRLAGKLDAVPGRTTILRLQADEPGIYRGQCAEFCGLHHAHMQFTVTAHPPADFHIWQEGAHD